MPFTRRVLDETREMVQRLWTDAWTDPEHPPRVYCLDPTTWPASNGEDISERYRIEHSLDASGGAVWTFTALEDGNVTHAATDVGWVSFGSVYRATPLQVCHHKGDAFVSSGFEAGIDVLG